METAKASKLLKELKGSKFLPYYNVIQKYTQEIFQPCKYLIIKEELIKELKQDIKGYIEEFFKIMKDNTDDNESKEKQQKNNTHMKTLYFIIYRFKRIILAYLYYRMNVIEQYFWEFGQNLPNEYKEYLHLDEKKHAENYKSLIFTFSNNMMQNYEDVTFDLTKDLEPPHNSFIEIRVLQDCGDILTSYGETLKLSKDTQHYVKRTEVTFLIIFCQLINMITYKQVEHLILQGYLKPID